jgi:hypothetical protein
MKHSIWHTAPLLWILACGGQSGSDDSTGGTAGSGALGGSGGSGGGSSGGAGAGGSSGTGAISGSGGASAGGTAGQPSGGAGGLGPECTADAECKLFSDCCTCAGMPESAPDPGGCDLACIQDSCSAAGIGKAICAAGRCVAGFECDPMQTICFSLPPTCQPGQVPSVVGGCWGACVDATECRNVQGCSECDGANVACVHYDLQGGDGPASTHCVDIPEACGGVASCACLGPSVCTSPYLACQDFSGIKGVSCSCPNC